MWQHVYKPAYGTWLTVVSGLLTWKSVVCSLSFVPFANYVDRPHRLNSQSSTVDYYFYSPQNLPCCNFFLIVSTEKLTAKILCMLRDLCFFSFFLHLSTAVSAQRKSLSGLWRCPVWVGMLAHEGSSSTGENVHIYLSGLSPGKGDAYSPRCAI